MYSILCLTLIGAVVIKNNKDQPIVSMVAIGYIDSIRLVPTYIQLSVVRTICAKFLQDSSKAKKAVCVAKD